MDLPTEQQRFCDGAAFVKRAWVVLNSLDDDGRLRSPQLQRSIGDSLNEYAPMLHDSIRFALLHEIIMGVCRLCEPSPLKGKDSQLSLETLIQAEPENSAASQKLKTIWSELKQYLPELEKIRHKEIAHADFVVSITHSGNHPVAGATLTFCIRWLDDAVKVLVDAYQCVDNSFEDNLISEATSLRSAMAKIANRSA